jgi:hypothetical protein
MPVEKALIDALIAPAKQHGTRTAGEFADHLLINASPGGREMNDRPGAGRVALPALAHCCQSTLKRLREQHHPRPATVRSVIDSTILAVRKVTQRPKTYIDLP